VRYIWQRGRGSDRRVMHLCGHDPTTGEPTLRALCGIDRQFDTSINPPFRLGRPLCKRCEKLQSDEQAER